MANLAAFTLLLTYMCSALYHLPWGQLWTLTTLYPLRNQPILLRKNHPILSTTVYWHENNQINTITKCQHAPKARFKKSSPLCIRSQAEGWRCWCWAPQHSIRRRSSFGSTIVLLLPNQHRNRYLPHTTLQPT